MKPIFMAMGPEFKVGVKIPIFHNIDVYELMCHLLDIEPAPNNGSLHRAHSILKEEKLFSFGFTFITCEYLN